MPLALYACDYVETNYRILPLDVSTPTWMRGPGEATGCFALESSIDELSYTLNMDPVELRIKNFAEKIQNPNCPGLLTISKNVMIRDEN